MISVIVCSRSTALFEKLAQNITETIGIPYEIIRISNSNNSYSICAAYNEGASRASFNFLCFVHEDVLFHTKNWGLKIIDHFNTRSDIGVIGVAGSVYKSKMCSAWWQSEPGWVEHMRVRIIHHSQKQSQQVKNILINPYNELRSQVASIDGVLICTGKNIWLQHQFDDKLLTGFHGYDLDFSLMVGKTKKIIVVYDVLIEHFSGGNCDTNWVNALLKVHKKWESILPVNTSFDKISNSEYRDGWKRLKKHLTLLIKTGCNFNELIRSYNRLYALLDNKPGLMISCRHYLLNMYRITKIYLYTKWSL